MSKIMIIEDDIQLRNQLKNLLLCYGYDIVIVTDFMSVEQQFTTIKPDMVILDINLPYFDGNYFCRIFRRNSSVPIIITSARNGDTDQILSMELGADEYVIKPFNIQVLLAKINALFRRSYGMYAVSDPVGITQSHGIILDEKGFKISFQDKTLELSKNEYKLCNKFLSKADQVITREELLEELWDASSFVDDNTLTVNVTRLKNKFTDLGLPLVIKTKRGAGYIFDTQSLKTIE